MNKDTKKEQVAEMARTLGCEAETAELVLEDVRARTLTRGLTLARMKHDLTQKELAARMGCSESKVCRMEAAADADLNFGDILAYANAVGLELSFLFDDTTLPNATRIKHCVCKVASMLKHLTDLAAEDDEDNKIRNAINAFQVEVLMNFLIKYRESGAAIPSLVVSGSVPHCGSGVPAPPLRRARQSAQSKQSLAT